MNEIKAADVIAMFNRLRELPPQPIYMTEEEIVKMEKFADWLEGKGPTPTMDDEELARAQDVFAKLGSIRAEVFAEDAKEKTS